MKNLFEDIPTKMSDELTEILLDDHPVRIERIVSTGQASPPGFWYDQDEEEWVVVLRGEAQLMLEGDDRPITLQPGDHRHLAAHQKHRVESTSPHEPTVWLAVFYEAGGN